MTTTDGCDTLSLLQHSTATVPRRMTRNKSGGARQCPLNSWIDYGMAVHVFFLLCVGSHNRHYSYATLMWPDRTRTNVHGCYLDGLLLFKGYLFFQKRCGPCNTTVTAQTCILWLQIQFTAVPFIQFLPVFQLQNQNEI